MKYVTALEYVSDKMILLHLTKVKLHRIENKVTIIEYQWNSYRIQS